MSTPFALLVALVAVLAAATPAAATDDMTRHSVSSLYNQYREEPSDQEDDNRTRPREPCANLVHDGTAQGQGITLVFSGSYGFRLVHPVTGALAVHVTPYWCSRSFEGLPTVGAATFASSPERDEVQLLP